MVYRIEPKGKKKLLGIYKTKIHGKGFVVIPKDVRLALGLEKGKELSVEVRGKEIILRPLEFKFREGNINRSFLEKERHEAWILRGAYKEAEEFFKELAETLYLLYGKEFGYGFDEKLNMVFLKLGEGNLQEVPYISYFEDYHFNSGVIAINPGKDREVERILEEFIKSLSLRIKLKKIERPDGEVSFSIFEYPEFDKKEFGILLYLAVRIIENFAFV